MRWLTGAPLAESVRALEAPVTSPDLFFLFFYSAIHSSSSATRLPRSLSQPSSNSQFQFLPPSSGQFAAKLRPWREEMRRWRRDGRTWQRKHLQGEGRTEGMSGSPTNRHRLASRRMQMRACQSATQELCPFLSTARL